MKRDHKWVLRNIYKLLYSSERYARFTGVKIGVGCSIGQVHFGSEPYLVSIGNNVQVTDGVKFFTHGSAWLFRMKDPTFDYFGKIIVNDNVYIGNNVLLMPGVEIGSNVIIGAGSIVTKSIPNNSIYAGNPAKKIGVPDQMFENLKRKNLKTKGMTYEQKMKYLLQLGDDKFVKK
ncbi:MAG: acyltransferase [Flavobacteriales bacterium]